MAISGSNMNRKEVQCLERKRRNEARCAIRQYDEQARAVRENNYLKTLIKEYESLARIQGAMRCRMDQIWIEGSVESRRKQNYDAIYRIKVEKNRRAYASLVDYKYRIEHVRLGGPSPI